ncbi:MAG TPA: RagB/SusD family nutrient uptake outer membrane protein, partial [Flavisolibacter sp.]|nr:RagB/SusD family nutrient uptake outer membrane protein [Flavisolibacter sp.]
QQSDFAASRDAANEAITLYQGALENSFSNVFGAPNSSEDIFAIQVTTSSGTQGFNEFYSSAQRGDVQITNDFMSIFESSDKRANLFYVNNNSRYSTKFDELYGNVHIVRLAEMYLIRAETNFRLGTSVGATPVDDINKIRARAGLTGYTAADLTIDKILKERLLELAFEGSWLDDLKRTKGTIFSSSIAWNSPKLVFPIPKREIVVNSNLTQNEGY